MDSNKLTLVTVIVQSKYKTINDDTIQIRCGGGFIIGGILLVTCYHNYKKSEDEIPLEMEIWHLRDISKLDEYEVIPVILNMEYLRQFNDFESHKLDINDPKTDFIFLPLIRKTEVMDLKFRTTELNQNEQLYANGFVTKNNGREEYSQIKTSNYNKKFMLEEHELIALLGEANFGYSGSPILDFDGGIAGIICGGFEKDVESYLDKAINNGWIDESIRNEIIEGYKEGKKLVYAINVKYILKVLGKINATKQNKSDT